MLKSMLTPNAAHAADQTHRSIAAEHDERIANSQVLVVGKESVGKSQLISSLSGIAAGESNFRGSTVSVQRYAAGKHVLIDTPGILRASDTETTRRTLAAMADHDVVMLVVQATHLDGDLADMLPLVVGKRGVIAVTFWDKVQPGEASWEAIERLTADAGVTLVPVDARSLPPRDRHRLEAALEAPETFIKPALSVRCGWRIEPKAGLLEHRFWGPLVALVLLFLPALATIYGANAFAAQLDPLVGLWMQAAIDSVNATWPSWLQIVLTSGQDGFGYGLLNMGPFLLVWALPTVLLFALILAAYKASGLVERINWALHPLVRPLGLSGRDLVRVMMGFGCNVPAVISTRACSGCSRGPAISAIAFGAACSYQLPATLAVLAAVATTTGTPAALLSLAFLSYLLLTTLIYLRLTAPPAARSSLNVLMTPSRPFMQWPSPGSLWREASGTLGQFFRQALPVFVVICIVASLLAKLGVLDACSRGLTPLMRLFNLPAEAALPVVLASIRKDGIFLLAADDGLAFPMTITQVLTAVYLAGVLLPCLVTALTIARETSWWSTSKLLARQAMFAVFFALVLAWGGLWFV
jgi:ferrous iron transport protein B